MGFPHMRAEVHAGGVEPAEERRVRPRLTLHEIDGGGRRLVVDRLHPLLGQRAGVLDGLPADSAPARLLGRIVVIDALQRSTPRGPKACRNAGSRG